MQRFLFLFLLLAASCGPKKVHYMGPGHDADWPIEAPDAPTYSAFLRGEYHSSEQDIPEAISAFEEALKHDPKSASLMVVLANEWLRKGDATKAEQLATQATLANPKMSEAYFILGRIHGTRNEWDKAETDLKHALELDREEEPEAVTALVSIYLQSKQPEKAVEFLKGLLEQDPENAQAHYFLGQVYSEMNRLPEALAEYERAADLNPMFTSALKAVALIYEYQGKRKEAMAVFQKVLAVEPDNSAIRRHVGQIYLDQEDFENALKEFQTVVTEMPDDVASLLRIGLIHLRQEKLIEAEKDFSVLLESQPKLHRVRYYLGVVLDKLGRPDAALKNFRMIDSESEVYPDSRLAIAFLFETKGELAKAESALREGLSKQDKSSEMISALAGILVKMKKGDDAVTLLQQAIGKSPKDESLWFSLGEVHDRLGNLPKTEEAMRTVLEINPDNANALNYLGYTYAEKGVNLQEAEQLIKRAIEIKPKDGYIVDSLGWLYFKKGLFPDAVKKLEEAVRLTPNDPTIMEHLADALLKVGETKRAKETYQKALAVAKDEKDKTRLREKLKSLE